MRLGRRSVRGVSLVELLVAGAILAIVITTTVSMISASSSVTNTARQREMATRLGQNLVGLLSSVPYSATVGGVSLFNNKYTTNDADLSDSASTFTASSLASTAADHTVTELSGTPLAALLLPQPSNAPTFERYWNVAPAASGNGVNFSVIVRWKSQGSWNRVVLVGTKYQPTP